MSTAESRDKARSPQSSLAAQPLLRVAAGMQRGACYGTLMDCKPAHPAFFGLALLVGLTGCTSTSDRYPSLAIRDAERAYAAGAYDSPPVPPAAPVAPSPALAQKLSQLQGQARQAHQAFLAAAPRTRTLVNSAQGSSPASDSWVAAQVGISGLEANRNRAMVAMADLDELLLETEVEGGAREAVRQAHAAVNSMIQEEDSVLSGLTGRLRN